MRDVKLRLNHDALKQGAKTDELSRDIHVISEEIQSYKQRVTSSIIEIGKRLRHVKEYDLARGRWLDWLASLQIEARQAQRFMQAYEQFGNTSASTLLESGKIIEMLTLPPEVDRAEFIEKKHRVPSTGEEKTVAEMSTREIREVVKAERRAAGLVKVRESADRGPTLQPPNDKYRQEIDRFNFAVGQLHESARWAVFNCNVTVSEVIKISELPQESQEQMAHLIMGELDYFHSEFETIYSAIKKGLTHATIKISFSTMQSIKENTLLFFCNPGNLGEAPRMLADIRSGLIDEGVSENELVGKLNDILLRIRQLKEEQQELHEEFERESQGQFQEFFAKTTQMPRADGPYSILGLREGASVDEVKAKFRSLAKSLHSDTGGSDFLFQMIRAAYDEILAVERRAS